jgi:hypothetical protein
VVGTSWTAAVYSGVTAAPASSSGAPWPNGVKRIRVNWLRFRRSISKLKPWNAKI